MEKFIDFIKHPITISILVLAIGILGIWGIINAVPRTQVAKGEKRVHSWGASEANSKVTIEVWSDFQCPGCKFFWENVEKPLKQKYENQGQVRMIYQHYPLSFHTRADDIAEASEAASEQGKFFEYADILFANQAPQDNQASMNDSRLIELARQIDGIDIAKFEESLKSGKYAEVIDDYVKEGDSKGVNSTPTVFINGKEIRGQSSNGQSTIADFATIEAEINRILGITPSPTPGDIAS